VKIIYFGSDRFARIILERILKTPHTLSAVVTAPPAKQGRGRQSAETPVSIFASEESLPRLMPQSLKDPAFHTELSSFCADLFVVVSYGKILPAALLAIPALYAINIHPSLLPKYRGPSPINHALLNGDSMTGISVIRLNEKIDSGDIFFQESIPLDTEVNAEELTISLAEAAALRIEEILGMCERGEVTFIAQDESTRSYAPLLKKEDGRIDWEASAEAIHNRIRALVPWPSAYTYYKGKSLKLHRSTRAGTEDPVGGDPDSAGTIIALSPKGWFEVQTGGGILRVCTVQYEGKKRMSGFDWCNGQRLKVGDCLG
jgi:methionyl-tRNA formyltransferase